MAVTPHACTMHDGGRLNEAQNIQSPNRGRGRLLSRGNMVVLYGIKCFIKPKVSVKWSVLQIQLVHVLK